MHVTVGAPGRSENGYNSAYVVMGRLSGINRWRR